MEKLSDAKLVELKMALLVASSLMYAMRTPQLLSLCTELLELRKEVERLREALKPLAAMSDGIDDWLDEAPVVESWPEMPESWGILKVADIRRARAALANE